MKKILAFLLVAVFVISSSAISVFAVPAPNYYYGEVDDDNDITVLDATQIQRFLAKTITLEPIREALADFDGDGDVTVADATKIQMYVAGVLKHIPRQPNYIYTVIDIINVTSDFDSGKAMAGVPVTFSTTAQVLMHTPEEEPIVRYEYFVSGEISYDGAVYSGESPDFTFTFPEAGNYHITLKAYNRFDNYSSYGFDYEVVDNTYDGDLMVSGAHLWDMDTCSYENPRVIAHAYGGVAPYEYRFETTNGTVIQDYSDKNEVKLPRLSVGGHSIKILIRDANKDVTSDVFSFIVTQPLEG